MNNTNKIQEKIDHHWEKTKSVQKWITVFNFIKTGGWIISFSALIWLVTLFIKEENKDNIPSLNIFLLFFVGFLIFNGASLINDWFFEPKKEKILLESISEEATK